MQEPIAYHIRRREQPKIRELEPEHREQQAQRCDSRQSGSKLASIYQPIYFDAQIAPPVDKSAARKAKYMESRGSKAFTAIDAGPLRARRMK